MVRMAEVAVQIVMTCDGDEDLVMTRKDDHMGVLEEKVMKMDYSQEEELEIFHKKMQGDRKKVSQQPT